MRRIFPALLALALAAPCLAQDVGVRGKFGSDSLRWKAVDAAAVRAADGTLELLFARKRFDRLAWVEDRRLDEADLAKFLDNDDDYAPLLRIALDAEGRYLRHAVSYGRYPVAPSTDADPPPGLRLSSNQAQRIAGTLDAASGTLAAKLAFDLPVLAFGPLARPGTALPEDGGEPGRFLLAKSRAVWGGNLDRLLELMTPAERANALGHLDADLDFHPGDLDLSGSSFFMLKQRMNMPNVERITGGSVDGNRAWVDFAGSDGVIGPGEVSGTAVMKRDRKGRWSVERYATEPTDLPEQD